MNGWWKEIVARIAMFVVIVVIVGSFVVLVAGCQDEFYKCQSCGAAYKSPAMRPGLPGQMNKSTCRDCGGALWSMSEEASGWDEERYQDSGNEIGGNGEVIGDK